MSAVAQQVLDRQAIRRDAFREAIAAVNSVRIVPATHRFQCNLAIEQLIIADVEAAPDQCENCGAPLWLRAKGKICFKCGGNQTNHHLPGARHSPPVTS